MSQQSPEWIFSQEHKRHYRTIWSNDKWEIEWYSEGAPSHNRTDSGSDAEAHQSTFAQGQTVQNTPRYYPTPQSSVQQQYANTSYTPAVTYSNYSTQTSASNSYAPSAAYYQTQDQAALRPTVTSAHSFPTYPSSHNYQQAGYLQPPAPGNNASKVSDRGRGGVVEGVWREGLPHVEPLDSSYYVRERSFFVKGRVLSCLLTEPVGNTVTSYNDNMTYVSYGEMVYTGVRRFIVVKALKEFCFAVPIFTYGNQGTLKPGVRASEHAIVYTEGYEPTLLYGETGIHKDSIKVIPAQGVNALRRESRIYYGIHHPIQYNVKVRDEGMVCKEHIQNLIGSWREEFDGDEAMVATF